MRYGGVLWVLSASLFFSSVTTAQTCNGQYLHCPLIISQCKVSKAFQSQTGRVELKPNWWFETVSAAADGVVLYKRDERSVGDKNIVLEHDDGSRTSYGKLGYLRNDVEEGDRVKRGDQLATTNWAFPMFFQFLSSEWKFPDPTPCLSLEYGVDVGQCKGEEIPCPLSGECEVVEEFSPWLDDRNGVQLKVEGDPSEVYAVSSGIIKYVEIELWEDETWNYYHIRVNHPDGSSAIYHDLIFPDTDLFGKWYNGEDAMVQKGDVVGYTNAEHPFTFEYIPKGQLLQVDPVGCFVSGPGTDTIGTEGGEVALSKVGAVSFPADAISGRTSIEMKKTSKDEVKAKFNDVATLFGADERLSYEVEITLDRLPDVRGLDAMMALELPLSLRAHVQAGHRLEVFALVEQSDFKIELGSRDERARSFVMFDSSIVDTYDNPAIVFALPRTVFFSNSGSGYKAVVTVASTPGHSTASNTRRSRSRGRRLDSGKCLAAAIRCPVASGCMVITPFSEVGSSSSIAHYGIDLFTSPNEYILAAADGTVEFAGRKDDFGNTLVVRHEDGSATVYSHLGQRLKGVGDSVVQGDQIGRAWNSDDPSFPLHFEYVPNGQLYSSKSHIDPEPCIGGVDGSIEVGDNGKVADDVFGISIDGLYIGVTALGATSTLAVNGLLPGRHQLELIVWLALDGDGTYFIRLSDGITFSDGSTYKTGTAPMFSTRKYTIIVPDQDDDGGTAVSKENWWDNTEAGRDCNEWVRDDIRLPNFFPVQPSCPCRQLPPGNNVDAADGFQALKEANQQYHPGAKHCMRSDERILGRRSSGQQCCYDANGDLITGGLAAGTPDRYAPYSGPTTGFFGHMIWDVLPAEDCPCATYLALRPPDNENGCKSNVVNAC